MNECTECGRGFLTKSEVFKDPLNGSSIILEWCSNLLCDYNVRKKV